MGEGANGRVGPRGGEVIAINSGGDGGGGRRLRWLSPGARLATASSVTAEVASTVSCTTSDLNRFFSDTIASPEDVNRRRGGRVDTGDAIHKTIIRAWHLKQVSV